MYVVNTFTTYSDYRQIFQQIPLSLTRRLQVLARFVTDQSIFLPLLLLLYFCCLSSTFQLSLVSWSTVNIFATLSTTELCQWLLILARSIDQSILSPPPYTSPLPMLAILMSLLHLSNKIKIVCLKSRFIFHNQVQNATLTSNTCQSDGLGPVGLPKYLHLL